MLQQRRLPVPYDPHGATDFGTGHAFGPDQFRFAGSTAQIDLGLPIAENMDMRRFVIVDENDDAKSASPKHSDHTLK